MLRDGATGLEVFLLKRHGLSDVLGGAYVFPGGKLDAIDSELDMTAHLDLPPHQLHSALNERDIDALAAASLYVAALREAFEESGVLFAHGLAAGDAARAYALLREGYAFDEVLEQSALRLAASALAPWSRWITPVTGGVSRKRFDTRFFVAAVPRGQQARHDDIEATESVWLSPRTALEQYWAGKIELAPPQIMSLAHLSRHASVGSVLAQARGRVPPVILPEAFLHEGDPRHPVRERALPGPTRLHFRNRRFEPSEGFEALFY